MDSLRACNEIFSKHKYLYDRFFVQLPAVFILDATETAGHSHQVLERLTGLTFLPHRALIATINIKIEFHPLKADSDGFVAGLDKGVPRFLFENHWYAPPEESGTSLPELTDAIGEVIKSGELRGENLLSLALYTFAETKFLDLISVGSSKSLEVLKGELSTSPNSIYLIIENENQNLIYRFKSEGHEKVLAGTKRKSTNQELETTTKEVWDRVVEDIVVQETETLMIAIEEIEVEMGSRELPPPPISQDESELALSVIQKFVKAFIGLVEGSRLSNDPSIGGKAIYDLFFGGFPDTLEAVSVYDLDLENSLSRSNGIRPHLFSPNSAFQTILSNHIKTFRDPCIDMVRKVSDEIGKIFADSFEESHRYWDPHFARVYSRILDESNRVLDSRRTVACDMILRHLEVESCFLNLNHPSCERLFEEELSSARKAEHARNNAMVHRRVSWNHFVAMTSNGPTCAFPTMAGAEPTRDTDSIRESPPPTPSPRIDTHTPSLNLRENVVVREHRKPDVNHLKVGIAAYTRLVRTNLLDMIPKIIMHDIVKYLEENLENELRNAILDEQTLQQIFRIPEIRVTSDVELHEQLDDWNPDQALPLPYYETTSMDTGGGVAVDESNVSLLVSMGFLDEPSCRRALRLGKNDISEAISYLTNETPGLDDTSYGETQGPSRPDAVEVFRKVFKSTGTESEQNSDTTGSTVRDSGDGSPSGGTDSSSTTMLEGSPESSAQDSESLEFPTTQLYELESRVYATSWNVPYGKQESLGRCLSSSIRLAKERLLESDDSAVRFLERCMPTCFEKLLTSNEVISKWTADIQKGILDMLTLLMELVAVHIEHRPLPLKLLDVFAMSLDPSNNFHTKNKNRDKADGLKWDRAFGVSKWYGVPSQLDAEIPYGYLVTMINEFALHDGFKHVEDHFRNPTIDAQEMLALLHPFAQCAEFLNNDICGPVFKPCLIAVVNYVENFTDADLKLPCATYVIDLLCCVNKIRKPLWLESHIPEKKLEELRLGFIIRLLKSAHFGARMQALREVSKLLDAINDVGYKQNGADANVIPASKISEWLTTNKILSLALEGNIDQSQYCDRLKTLLTFLGPRLTCPEISKIWAMRKGRAAVAVDNVYHILAQAASKFGKEQEIDHLISLIQKSWEKEEERARERTLKLLGSIGMDTSFPYTQQIVLDLLWKLIHEPKLHRELIRGGMEQHLAIINKSKKEDLRQKYISECLKNLTQGINVILALHQIQELISGMQATSSTGGWNNSSSWNCRSATERKKTMIDDLCKNNKLLETVDSCLVKTHETAVSIAKSEPSRSTTPVEGTNEGNSLPASSLRPEESSHLLLIPAPHGRGDQRRLEPDFGPDLVMPDGRQFGQHVDTILQFLSFILKEGDMTLPWSQAKELWQILVENSCNIRYEKDACFNWFQNSSEVLSEESKQKLLQEKFLKMDPSQIGHAGFSCFQKYFQLVNKAKGKLKSTYPGQKFEVEQCELLGLEFVWDVALSSGDMEIVEQAIQMLITYSYSNLSHKLKKDAASIHRKFLEECSTRLEATLLTLKGSMVGRALTEATKVLTALSVPRVNYIPPSGQQLKRRSIERVLLIAQRYVMHVEQDYKLPRMFPPHASTFFALNHFTVHAISEMEGKKGEWDLTVHENETLRSLRERIAVRLGMEDELGRVELDQFNEEIPAEKDQLTLRQLGIFPGAFYYTNRDEPIVFTIKRRYPSAIRNDEYYRRPGYLRSGGGEASSSSNWTSKNLDGEKGLPSVLISTSNPVFELLYELALLEDAAIGGRVRDLLSLTPSDPGVTSVLEEIIRPVGPSKSNSFERRLKQALPASFSSNSLERKDKSPKLKIKGHSRKSSSDSANVKFDEQLTTEEKLKRLLDFSQQGFGALRLLYNLEILASFLIPTQPEELALRESAQFAENFVKAGGIVLLVNLLKRDTLPVSLEIYYRQEIYSRIIQILNFVLCGDSILHRIVSCERRFLESCGEQRSSSPQPPAAAAASVASAGAASADFDPSSYSLGKLDIPRLNVVRQIVREDFATILESLQRIAWTASAGILHAIATCDLKSPNNSGSSPRGRVSESSTGSSDGSGAMDAPSSVHTGLLSGSNFPNQMDEDLVCRAVELMVECVMLRQTDVSMFFNLPYFADFILDLLLVAPSRKIRGCAEHRLLKIADKVHKVVNGSPVSGSVITPEGGDDLRKTVLHQKLSNGEQPENGTSDATESSSSGGRKPRLILLQILLRAHLPLWCNSSSLRGINRRLLSQCAEYFGLRRDLINVLPSAEFNRLQPSPRQMLDDECNWLMGFTCSPDHRLAEIDSQVVAGHVKLITTLCSKLESHKRRVGKKLIKSVVEQFLFPASEMVSRKAIPDGEDLRHIKAADCRAKARSGAAKRASYDLMRELCYRCPENFLELSLILQRLHHEGNNEISTEWDYSPLVESKMDAGYVGLKNAGATCYMNSVLQQFFMEPNLPDRILSSLDSDFNEDVPLESQDTSLMVELQRLFGHLKESDQQYYVPKKFWELFRLWGEKVNVREQQDAFEFYTCLIDQIDEELKKNGREEIFKKKYLGVFSDQKICHGCPHKYERDEVFYALNLPLRAHGLEDSLQQFVKGEILEGDNAYFCEKCGEKRTTLKRMCIKTLPPVMTIQLKRFDYDWEENRALKFNDKFQFPLSLDMQPYTASFLNSSTATAAEDSFDFGNMGPGSFPGSSPMNASLSANHLSAGGREFLAPSSAGSTPVGSPITGHGVPSGAKRKSVTFRRSLGFGGQSAENANYELVGVVVHSGQANAGHYYAYIKERREEAVLNNNFGKWFKFNDTVVEHVEMSENFMENELFGGKYIAKNENRYSQFPEERERYWNAYLLIYARKDSSDVHPHERTGHPMMSGPGKRSVSVSYPNHLHPKSPRRRDSLGELAALVEQGERQQIFRDSGTIPRKIKEEIKEENLRFMRDRDVFSNDYFHFIEQLVDDAIHYYGRDSTTSGTADLEGLTGSRPLPAFKFALHYLLNLNWHMKKSMRRDPFRWVERLVRLLEMSPPSCNYLFNFLTESHSSKYLAIFLLDADSAEVRKAFGEVISKALRYGAIEDTHGTDANGRVLEEGRISEEADRLVKSLLGLVSKEAMDHPSKSNALFQIIYDYASLNTTAAGHLLHCGAFGILLSFMVTMPTVEEWKSTKSHQNTITLNRRWTLTQAREFGAIYNTLASLILSCELFQTNDPSRRIGSLKAPKEVMDVVSGPVMKAFISELIWAVTNVYNTSNLGRLVQHCCYGNEVFSQNVIEQCLANVLSQSSNELRFILGLLSNVLEFDDDLQTNRMQLALDGITGPTPNTVIIEGLLSLIESLHEKDSRKSYNCVKFLVSISEKSRLMKDLLNARISKWQWAVDWLREKMGGDGAPPGGSGSSGFSSSIYPPSHNQSNEDTTSRSFLRTVSAQYTLEQANALIESLEEEVNGDGNDEIQMEEGSSRGDGRRSGGGDGVLEIECSEDENPEH